MSSVVGAECRPGLVECAGRCVDTSNDPQHCGGCNITCGVGQWCDQGMCAGSLAGDGGVGADGGSDAGAPPRIDVIVERPPPFGDPVLVDPVFALPVADCEIGELSCGGRCVRARSDREHCGACGNRCGAAEVCAAGACVGACEAPLSECAGACVDTSNDADHCGGCDVRCSSRICREGVCESPVAGHLVVIGHDYTTRRPAMSRLAGNAVFMPPGREVRVVVFEGASQPASRAGTDAAIDEVASALGREWQRTQTSADRMSYDLAQADAVVIYAQDPSHASAVAIGRTWAKSLESFLANGGVVIVLVGSGAGGLALLEGAYLLDAAPALTDVSGQRVTLERATDAIAIGVPLTYRAEATSVRMDLPLDDAVVSDGLGPVVLHRIVVPVR